MRTIKFRIFDHENKVFVYFQLDRVPDQNIFNLNESEQFTGLIDKNGEQICEGDVLKSEEDLDKDCMYDDVTTYIKYSVVTKENGYFTNDSDNPFFLIMNQNHFEIVGNINQNPELLKS